MNPHIVYLDSSDFDNMAKSSGGVYSDIRKKLLNATKAGSIEIRYSYAHMLECAPLEHTAQRHSVLIGELISELSMGKCFVSASDLMEFSNSNSKIQNSNINEYQDCNMWISEKFILKILDADFIEVVDMKNQPNRRDRRRAAASLKSVFRSSLKNSPNRGLSELPGFINALENYYIAISRKPIATNGRISQSSAISVFAEHVLSPSNFLSYFSLFSSSDNKLIRKYFFELGIFLEKNFSLCNETFNGVGKRLRDGQQKKDIDHNETAKCLSAILLLSLRGSILEGFSCQDDTDIDYSKYGDHEFYEKNPELAFADLISSGLIGCRYINSVHLCLSEYIKRSNSAIAPMKPERGDFFDILHMGYIPYCNSFRMDKRMTPMVLASGRLYDTKTMPKITDLYSILE